MKKAHLRLLVTAMAVTVVGTTLMGCSKKKEVNTSSADDKSPITFTIFDGNHKDGGTTNDDPVGKEITKKTGVTLQYLPTSGDPNEKLNLMLASNDLPDLVQIGRGSDPMNKYISTGAVVPLNDLIDKYAPNIKTIYGDTLNKTRSEDGKNYYLADWWNPSVQKEPVFGFLMRKDYLKQIGVSQDVIDGTTPMTADQLESTLKTFKEKMPKINGQDSIPMTIWQENFTSGGIGTFEGMFGIKGTEVDASGNVKYPYSNPQFLEMLKYMNKLQSEGLIDAEWPANKQALWNQKLTSGAVLSTPDAYWNPGTADSALKKSNGVDAEFYPYKVVAPGLDASKTTYGPTSLLGWDGAMITKKNKNPERAIKFLNFLASDEGQYLTQWGIEGTDWKLDNGKHTPINDIITKYNSDPNYSKTSGIRKYALVFKGGLGTDGTPYDMAVRYQRDEVATHAIKALGDSVYDTTATDNLGPVAGTPESLIQTKINDITNVAIPKIMLAKSQDEAVSLYNKMISDLKAAGIDKVEKIMTDNYKKRLALWK